MALGDFAGESGWLTTIDAGGVEALAEAAAVLPADPHRWVEVDAGDVITDTVGDTLAGVAHDLWHGRGFFWLRGLPSDDPELLRRLFWVIGNNLGVPTMQNKRGQVLSEVFDRFEGAERVVDTRGYESSDELTFHCDGGDSIGLACVARRPSAARTAWSAWPRSTTSCSTLSRASRRARTRLRALLASGSVE